MVEDLTKELEHLRQLRESLNFDLKILEEREIDFKRVNRNLLRNIELKRDYVILSENKIKNIAEDVYREISFYLQIETKEPFLEELREKTPVQREEKLDSISTEPPVIESKKKWWRKHANSNVV